MPQLTALASHPQHPSSHRKPSKPNFHYLLYIQVFLDLNIVTAVLANLLRGDGGGQAMAEHLYHHNSITHHKLPNGISVAYYSYLKIVVGYPILMNPPGSDSGKQSVIKGSAKKNDNSVEAATMEYCHPHSTKGVHRKKRKQRQGRHLHRWNMYHPQSTRRLRVERNKLGVRIIQAW